VETLAKRLDLPGALSVTAGFRSSSSLDQRRERRVALVPDPRAPRRLRRRPGRLLVIEHMSKAPLMPLGFLRRGAVFSANALAILTISAVSSMIFLLTIYLQTIQGYSALSAGLAFLPTALIFLSVGGYLSARLVTRFGAKPVLLVA